MAFEAIVGYTIGVAFIVGLALYMNRHRAEDQHKNQGKQHHA